MKKKTVYAVFAALLIGMLFLYPKEMVAAASQGLLLWFQNVLPSLFPFMALSLMLVELDVPKWLGKLASPMMKPLFRVSGAGAFPMIMGMICGYPTGAKITAQMQRKGELTPGEAQRIMSFSNLPGPIFVLGTVAGTLLQKPALGYFMIGVFILGAVITGVLFRFYQKKEVFTKTSKFSPPSQETQTLGRLLGQSIQSALDTITQVGGFIILFSVIIQAIKLSGLPRLFQLLPLSSSGQQILEGGLYGIIEMTNGASILCNAALPEHIKVVLLIGVLSFGGLSIFAQTISVIQQSQIKPGIYFFSKLVQSIISMAFGYILYPLFAVHMDEAMPVFAANPNPISYTAAILPVLVLLVLLGFLFRRFRRN